MENVLTNGRQTMRKINECFQHLVSSSGKRRKKDDLTKTLSVKSTHLFFFIICRPLLRTFSKFFSSLVYLTSSYLLFFWRKISLLWNSSSLWWNANRISYISKPLLPSTTLLKKKVTELPEGRAESDHFWMFVIMVIVPHYHHRYCSRKKCFTDKWGYFPWGKPAASELRYPAYQSNT